MGWMFAPKRRCSHRAKQPTSRKTSFHIICKLLRYIAPDSNGIRTSSHMHSRYAGRIVQGKCAQSGDAPDRRAAAQRYRTPGRRLEQLSPIVENLVLGEVAGVPTSQKGTSGDQDQPAQDLGDERRLGCGGRVRACSRERSE